MFHWLSAFGTQCSFYILKDNDLIKIYAKLQIYNQNNNLQITENVVSFSIWTYNTQNSKELELDLEKYKAIDNPKASIHNYVIHKIHLKMVDIFFCKKQSPEDLLIKLMGSN